MERPRECTFRGMLALVPEKRVETILKILRDASVVEGICSFYQPVLGARGNYIVFQ